MCFDNDGDGIKDEPADPVTGQQAEPSIGIVNKLYARVRNLGNSAASNVKVKFSYLPAGIGATDYLDIGSKTINLAVGAEQEVQVDWDLTNLNEDNAGKWSKPIKDHDHFCVRVTLESTGDLNTDNNLAKNNFANVPVVTSPGPKTALLHFIMANSNNFPVTAGLTIYPLLSKDWQFEFKGLKEYSSFPLQANEQRFITMAVTPPRITVDEDYEYGKYTSAYVGKRRDIISEQIIDVSGHINGEMVGGMSYNLLLTREELVRRWTLSIHSGTAIPVGDLADSYDPGFNVILDIDYHINPRISLVALFGYNNFKDKANGDFYWLNLSGNARYYYLRRGRTQYFVGAGPGVYIPESGSSKYGFNSGIGIDFAITSWISTEVGGDYHLIFDGDNKFVHAHAGLVFKF